MTNLNDHIKQQQEVNRGKAEEAIFPIPLSLLKSPKEDVKRVDEEIYKVIDTLTADTIKNTLEWVREIVREMDCYEITSGEVDFDLLLRKDILTQLDSNK